MKNAFLVAVVVVILLGGGSLAGGEARAAGPVIQVVEINGHRARFDNGSPAFVRYLLIDPSNADLAVDGFPPVNPVAVLMLFVGSEGRVNLSPFTQNIGTTNFLGRTRYHFAAQGYVVAVVDAASDFLVHNHGPATDLGFPHGNGLAGHRLPDRLHGDKYQQDLTAVMANLRARYPSLPLWAVGTSRGTISAALAAANVTPPPDGIVLTASLTGPSGFGDLRSVDVASITIPTLIVTNLDDECPTTRPEDSIALKNRFVSSPRVQVVIVNGRSVHPLSDSCGPLAGHGFFGIEQHVIQAITRWINPAAE